MDDVLSQSELELLMNNPELFEPPDLDCPSDIEYTDDDPNDDLCIRPPSPLRLDSDNALLSVSSAEDDENIPPPDSTDQHLDNETEQANPNSDADGDTGKAVPSNDTPSQKTKKKVAEPEPNRHWKKKQATTDVPNYPQSEDCLHSIFGRCKTGTDVFVQLLRPCLENILFQSNLYATQKDRVLNLTDKDLLAFIGINFFMGYHVLPSKQLYWSTQEDLGVASVARVMSRNRFNDILSFLHVNDNSAIPEACKNKLFKLRPMISSLKETFFNSYDGTIELSVDESIVLFKGRSTMKQYNPMKPIKRGFKIWCIADQRGFTSDFDIYQGKNEVVEQEFENFGLGERVVLSLTKKFWGQNRAVFFDNYFSSVKLVERLKAENTLACGTIKLGRKGLPTNMATDKDLKERGDYDHRVSSLGVSFFKWRDNKIVHFISNFHGTKEDTVKRTQKDGTKAVVKCPLAVKEYNNFMGGVDLADRYRALYDVNRKSKKWWHRLFFALLDITFVNAYVISTEMFGPMPVLDFRRSVALGLMAQRNPPTPQSKHPALKKKLTTPEPFQIKKRRKANFSVVKDVRLSNLGAHWPVVTKTRGRCEKCSMQKIQSKPTTKCSLCNVHLCLNDKKNCFAMYHNVEV